jgi:hypothetical protein
MVVGLEAVMQAMIVLKDRTNWKDKGSLKYTKEVEKSGSRERIPADGWA